MVQALLDRLLGRNIMAEGPGEKKKAQPMMTKIRRKKKGVVDINDSIQVSPSVTHLFNFVPPSMRALIYKFINELPH